MQHYKIFLILLFLFVVRFIFDSQTISAAPYFYMYGTSSASAEIDQTWLVGLFTDGSTLTAAQTVVSFDETLMRYVQLSNLNSRCSFWAPPDPSLGFGSGTTPFVVDDNKIVISCGFSNPGYVSTNGVGDVVLSITMKPLDVGMGSFSFSDTQLRYIGNTIVPGVSPSYDFSIDSSATPSATPTPTPTPSPTPAVDVLKASDLTAVSLGRSSSRSASTAQSGLPLTTQELADAVALDNVIPPPPADLALRPKATPHPFLEQPVEQTKEEGEVLSLQSLQELLIPGKSQADRTLVLFNFVMMITFVTLMAILIWRLITTKRANKLKYKHMNEILEGELAVIESKISGVKQGTVTGEEVAHSFEDLKNELESKI